LATPSRSPEQSGAALARFAHAWRDGHAACLDRLFAMVSDLIVVTGGDAGIMVVNPAWQEVLGWSEDELIGRSVFELVHPDDDSSTRALAARGQTVVSYTKPLPTQGRQLAMAVMERPARR
jgi:PAS domain S-box-containing protein